MERSTKMEASQK
ncbi:hypothetical protein IEO21_10585 [Rhodonia placenta]|uniref:Uncharacterized protein n=1 Tax=Rhodonia placenta TaxID=104341 RepID=A0A8H7TWJ7_9APHY|nr:hypothetical protein IEO21_10585 [Postia placenta]